MFPEHFKVKLWLIVIKIFPTLGGTRAPGNLWNPPQLWGESVKEPPTAEQVYRSKGLIEYQADTEDR